MNAIIYDLFFLDIETVPQNIVFTTYLPHKKLWEQTKFQKPCQKILRPKKAYCFKAPEFLQNLERSFAFQQVIYLKMKTKNFQ